MEQTRILKKDVSFTEAIEELYNGTCDRAYYKEIISPNGSYLYLENDCLKTSVFLLGEFKVTRDSYNRKFDTAKILSDEDIIKELKNRLLVSKLTNYLLINKTVGVTNKFYLDEVRYAITGLNLPCPYKNSINVVLDGNTYCIEIVKEEYNHG